MKNICTKFHGKTTNTKEIERLKAGMTILMCWHLADGMACNNRYSHMPALKVLMVFANLSVIMHVTCFISSIETHSHIYNIKLMLHTQSSAMQM